MEVQVVSSQDRGDIDGLPNLAKIINQLHHDAESHARNAIDFAFDAGEQLIKAKALCGHGAFGGWVASNCDFTSQTARTYIRLASNPKGKRAFVSIRDALKALAGPRGSKATGEPGEPAPEDTCTVDDLTALAESGQQFGTIYADPPWQYGNQATRASTDKHYKTMTVDEICALPIEALAAERAHLHLWTTNAFLFDAKRVIEAWGFEYRSCFVWCKPQMGIGNYWRVSHEFLLLGIRGDAITFTDKTLKSWESLDRGKHSQKPEAVRRKIEAASLTLTPRLELFARVASEGWSAWGNEVQRDLLTIDAASI